MSGNIKRRHQNNCQNNCKIHHKHGPFYYHQYPLQPCFPYATPPLVQYSLPQSPYAPLFTQYQYSSVIQQPPFQQPNQMFNGMIPQQPNYNYSNYSEQPTNSYNHQEYNNQWSRNMPINSNDNHLTEQNQQNNNYRQRYAEERFHPNEYDLRSRIDPDYYNDFSRSVSPLSIEEEYNWSVHISDILDEFINRNRTRTKSNVGEYKELKYTLDTSLQHLKEAEELNKSLVDSLAKKEEIKSSPISSSETVILPTINLKEDEKLAEDNEIKSTVEINPITDLTEDNKVTASSTETNQLDEQSSFDFFDFDDNFDDLDENDEHSFYFDDGQINNENSKSANTESLKDIDTDFDNIFLDDINDFMDANAPTVEFDKKVENDVRDDLEDQSTEKIKDTVPVKATYKDYTVKTLLGKIQASEIYDKMFDEYGQNKMSQIEVMDEFGLEEKQYNKLIDNFYKADKKQKKVKEEQIGVVITAKRFNKKAFWIVMSIIFAILLIFGIIAILYFTVPIVANFLQPLIDKIKMLF